MTPNQCFHCDEPLRASDGVVRVLWRQELRPLHLGCVGFFIAYLLYAPDEQQPIVEVRR